MEKQEKTTKSTSTELMEKLLPAAMESAREALETMAFTSAEFKPATLEKDGYPKGAISGSIGISGEQVSGSVSLIFTQQTIENIYRAMIMLDPDAPVEHTELKDAVGEMANMVAGGAKGRMQVHGINFNIGLPTIVVGENHHIEPPSNAVTSVITVESGQGRFYMEITV